MYLAALLLCHGAAWTLALAFLRAARKKIALTALCSALFAAAVQLLLLWQGWNGLEILALISSSLATALVLPEFLHITWRDAATAFLLGQGGGMLLWGCADSLPLLVGMLCVYLVLTAVLAPYYPQSGWRELPAAEAGAPGRPRSPNAIFAVICLAINAAAFLPSDGWAAVGLRALGMLLYWCGICLVIAMAAHQRAALAVTSEKQYREEMETFMNVIRSQRHDYNFHVRTLAGLVQSGDMDACRAYLDELVQDSVEMNQLLPIQDPAISATIFSFRALAARAGIRLHIDVQNDLSAIATNVYETNKIISNLLQNAIDEVSTHADKSYGIWLYVLKRGQFCLIHTANELGDTPVDGNVFRQGYTTKSGHDGVGLSSVRALVERYHGLVYTRQEDGLIHFVAQIPLRT